MAATSSEHSHLAGGPGAIGCKFAEYCTDNNLNPDKQIPKVDIKYKIYRVSDFDQKKGTIYVGQKTVLDPNKTAEHTIEHVLTFHSFVFHLSLSSPFWSSSFLYHHCT